MGNVCQDIELRDVNGTSVTNLRLAVNERYKTSSGEKKEDTAYVDVDVWGRQAEIASEYLKNGSPILIEGRLRQDTWEKDGQKFSKLKVRCDNLTLLPRGGGGSGDSEAAATGTAKKGKDIPF